MIIFVRFLLFFVFMLAFSACEVLGLGSTVTVEGDPIVKALQEEVATLQGDLNKLKETSEKLEKFKKTQEIERDLRIAIQREEFEKTHWEKKIFELLAARKVRLNQRIRLLSKRKRENRLKKEVIEKEFKEYQQNKKLKPLKKGWENRYKAAIDL